MLRDLPASIDLAVEGRIQQVLRYESVCDCDHSVTRQTDRQTAQRRSLSWKGVSLPFLKTSPNQGWVSVRACTVTVTERLLAQAGMLNASCFFEICVGKELFQHNLVQQVFN